MPSCFETIDTEDDIFLLDKLIDIEANPNKATSFILSCTVGHIGNFWFITKSRFYTNFGPKKVVFFYFGAIFGVFSTFCANVFTQFKFSRPRKRDNLFCAKMVFKMSQRVVILPTLPRPTK